MEAVNYSRAVEAGRVSKLLALKLPEKIPSSQNMLGQKQLRYKCWEMFSYFGTSFSMTIYGHAMVDQFCGWNLAKFT